MRCRYYGHAEVESGLTCTVLLIVRESVELFHEKKGNVEALLERRIIEGLRSEWAMKCSTLVPNLRERLKIPVFQIKNMKNLGLWDQKNKVMAFSRELVFSGRWDSVREVLHHEIAHQLAMSYPGARKEPPHGETFRKCCTILGADPAASGSFVPLHEKIAAGTENENDTILLKVKKLMALAESSNIHEAELAAAKASELITKHNIDIISRDEERRFVSVFAGRPALRHSGHSYVLAGLLQEFYFVRVISAQVYVVEREKTGRAFEISGTVENVRIASYVYDYVDYYIEREWDRFKKRQGHGRNRVAFCRGVVEGFYTKLKKQRDKQLQALWEKDKKGYSIVKGEDTLLESYYQSRYPYTRSHTHRNRYDIDALNEGMKRGEKLVISKGISEKNKAGKKYITQ